MSQGTFVSGVQCVSISTRFQPSACVGTKARRGGAAQGQGRTGRAQQPRRLSRRPPIGGDDDPEPRAERARLPQPRPARRR